MTFIVNVKRFLWVVLLIPAGLTAQTFNWDAVKQQVISAHPLAKQADYLLGLGSAAILKAKGAFDPKIYGTHDAKSFNGKNYFQLSESGLKGQARGGLEWKGAYQLATGN
ncbi:MAG: hypothetical protein JNJ57_10445, partial [Saprospiraceae bacterium]|nr:hypothetical protein [Saprospiraceae bacterium]